MKKQDWSWRPDPGDTPEQTTRPERKQRAEIRVAEEALDRALLAPSSGYNRDFNEE